jgi:TonB family protein
MKGARRRRVRRAALALCVVALSARLATAQSPVFAQGSGGVTFFEGATLSAWQKEHIDATFAADVLTVSGGSGWLRHEKVFANFRLTMDVRVIGRGARAGVYVRSWPTFDEDTNLPNNAYRVDVANDQQGAPADEVPRWQRVDILCNGRTLSVRIDDREVLTRDDIENPQGFVALTAQGGRAEFRHLEITPLRRQPPRLPPGVSLPGKGIAPPRPVKDVKPQYSADAMRARISGGVLVDAVVLADGTIGNVEIVRSLDPRHGLDDNAVEAARQWRFEPGTKDGVPVPVLISIELTFSLR